MRKRGQTIIYTQSIANRFIYNNSTLYLSQFIKKSLNPLPSLGGSVKTRLAFLFSVYFPHKDPLLESIKARKKLKSFILETAFCRSHSGKFITRWFQTFIL